MINEYILMIKKNMFFDGSMKILTKGTFDNVQESTVDGVIPKNNISPYPWWPWKWTIGPLASIGMFTIDLWNAPKSWCKWRTPNLSQKKRISVIHGLKKNICGCTKGKETLQETWFDVSQRGKDEHGLVKLF